MDISNYSELRDHAGHAVEIVVYDDGVGVALVCLDCNETLLNFKSNDWDSPVFIPATGTAVMKDGGEKIIIKSASKDGRWYVDIRDRLYSQAKLKYIKIAIDNN